MAVTVLPPQTDEVHIRVGDWVGLAVAFVIGGLAGFSLMALLSLSIWPSVFPYSDDLLQGSGLAVSLFIALICGIAGVVMAAARQSAR